MKFFAAAIRCLPRCGLVVMLAGLLVAGAAGAFEQIEAENFAKQDFVFPDDISGAEMHLLFLGIAKDQDNGTWQGEELIRWHRALLDADALPESVRAWHFPVMESPPFFVKGVIRRAIAKSYVDLVPSEQGAVLYVKDLQRFAELAGLPADGQPTVLAWTPADGVLAAWRGTVSESAVTEIEALLNPVDERQATDKSATVPAAAASADGA